MAFQADQLLGLAQEYLDLVSITNEAHGDSDNRPHAAAQRAVIHDQILDALNLTRADSFNAIAWAKATVAAAAQQRADPATFYANLPFATTQPLERYRLDLGMSLMTFVVFLGITEVDYLRLIAGDRHLSAEIRDQIADRLGTLPWLINEIAPLPTPQERDAVYIAIAAGEDYGYVRVDSATGELSGPFLLDYSEEMLDSPIPPSHRILMEAFSTFRHIHTDSSDPDTAGIHAYLEDRIRTMLGLSSDAPIDMSALVDESLEERLRKTLTDESL